MAFVPLAKHAPTETILFVDDEPSIRTLFSDALRQAGYNVIAARNGADAVDALRSCSTPVDLVVTDVVMPKVSGSELFAMLRRGFPDLRVLLISGYSDGAVAASDLVDMETEFLAKPFGPETLLARVRGLLDPVR